MHFLKLSIFWYRVLCRSQTISSTDYQSWYIYIQMNASILQIHLHVEHSRVFQSLLSFYPNDSFISCEYFFSFKSLEEFKKEELIAREFLRLNGVDPLLVSIYTGAVFLMLAYYETLSRIISGIREWSSKIVFCGAFFCTFNDTLYSSVIISARLTKIRWSRT